MDIKDISGLGEPMKKLIEVISSGVGHLARPYLIKRDADAHAYEFGKMIESLNKAKSLPSGTEIDYLGKEGYKVKIKDNNKNLAEPDNKADVPLLDRYKARAAYQNAKRQQNLEKIIQVAVNQVSTEERVSDEKLDDDWVARFFADAENISTGEMQILWGRVLAGEVTKPKSFSLRTLDIIKNLTKEDAQIIEKNLRYSIYGGFDKFFILKDVLVPKQKAGMISSEVALLRELGVLYESDYGWDINYETVISDTSPLLFMHGKKILLIERQVGMPSQFLPVFQLTRTGRELTNLIDIEGNVQYLRQVASHFKHVKAKFQIADLISTEGNVVRYKNELSIEI